MTTTTGATDLDQAVSDAIAAAGLHPDHAEVDQLRQELDRRQPSGYLTRAGSLRAVVGLLLEAYANHTNCLDLLRAELDTWGVEPAKAPLMGAGRMTGRPKITNVRPADDHNQVVTVEGGSGDYRRRPCNGCPWRVDQTGSFPAEAFRISAPTAYDLSARTFACHEAGTARPKICAGFLLRGAGHNMAIRMRTALGLVDLDSVDDGGHALHPSYRAMAEANGVPADDPALAPCRESGFE
jgi:hypothetical protein